jgi:RNA polymerase sigma-70 factor (ECF subfamily)
LEITLNKEERFNKIVVENQERILRICRYYNANVADQKDMHQEILINIWKSLDHYRGEAAINTWVYRVAVNTALSYTGKAFREMKLMVDAETENLHLFIDEQELEQKQLEEEQLILLKIELNTLSVIDKALVSLLLEGLSMKEISDVIGITEPNVKVKIHRIKAQLKTRLNKNSHEPK